MFIISGPLLICFMLNRDIDKDFHILLSFPDQATPWKLQNNIRIILGSKPENFKNIEAQKKCVIGLLLRLVKA